MQKLIKLCKKWFRKIVVHAKSHGVPIIAPPNITIINHNSGFRGKSGNYTLLGYRTLISMQASFVSPRKPSLHSAIWAKCRRRDTNFLVKAEIIRLDSEVVSTVLTSFSFGF